MLHSVTSQQLNLKCFYFILGNEFKAKNNVIDLKILNSYASFERIKKFTKLYPIILNVVKHNSCCRHIFLLYPALKIQNYLHF